MRVLWPVLVLLYIIKCGDATLVLKLDKANRKAKDMMKEDAKVNRKFKQEGVDNKDGDTADSKILAFANPAEKTQELAKVAMMYINTVKQLANMTSQSIIKIRSNKRLLKAWSEKLGKYCSSLYEGSPCNRSAIYRTADGSCNNLNHPTWGSSFCPQARLIPPMYDDGIDKPRETDFYGNPLPGPRDISNKVHTAGPKPNLNKEATVMVMQWGQFIDHEFVQTPILKGDGGTKINCCVQNATDRPECFPIKIPDDDPFFNYTCMNFVRSAPVPTKDCNPGFREVVNQVTSVIDGSALYGSTKEAADSLRTFINGTMKTGPYNLLPPGDKKKCRVDVNNTKFFCFKAGDGRVNVVPSLGMSHNTFLREHNRLVHRMSGVNPHWDDETLYQQVRKIIAAVEQHITYTEYLPAILNEETMDKYDLRIKKPDFHTVYRPGVNPTITNSFAAASFRFGHSQIPNYQGTMEKGFVHLETQPIENCYHEPHMLQAHDARGLDGVARWVVTDATPAADRFFESGYRDKLFLDKMGKSFDLVAINIQRGRDHGLPSYNHWRIYCKLPRVTHFGTSEGGLVDHDPKVAKLYSEIYKHPDDIDLFSAAISERHLPDSSVGPTFACMLGVQFKRLRVGDRFWYENRFTGTGFTRAQLREIKKMSLAKIICENYAIDNLQPNVFKVPKGTNRRISCNLISDIDLNKWKAIKRTGKYGQPLFKRFKKKY